MHNNFLEIKAVRSSIKRSFPSKVEAIIGELLQNSQRAGATCIDFIIAGNTNLLIFDNGRGIKDFRDLIVLGKSNYDRQITDWQHPIGVGFQSLLAHDEVNFSFQKPNY